MKKKLLKADNFSSAEKDQLVKMKKDIEKKVTTKKDVKKLVQYWDQLTEEEIKRIRNEDEEEEQ